VIASVDVPLPTGNRREALQHLTDAGFTVRLTVTGHTAHTLRLGAVLALRRIGGADGLWIWRAMVDTCIPVDAADTVNAHLDALATFDRPAGLVVLAPTVVVIACVATAAPPGGCPKR